MKYLLLISLLFTAHPYVSENDSCRPILEQAQAAYRAGKLSMALEKLQDAATCDFKNILVAELRQLETQIFEAIQLQKQEALNQRQIAVQAQAATQEALEEAERQRRVAESARDEAEAARDEAERQQELAVAAKLEAVRQEMLTISRSLSMKSVTVSDARIQALLALQAYRFYERDTVADLRHNSAIFEGLYFARKALYPSESNRTRIDSVRGRYEIAFGRAGDTYLVSSPQGNLRKFAFDPRAFLQNTSSGNLLLQGQDWNRDIRVHSSGEYAAYWDEKNTIRVLPLDDPGLTAWEYKSSDPIQCFSFSEAQAHLLITNRQGEILEWDFEVGTIVNALDFHEPLRQVRSHPRDGRIFACTKSGALLYQGLGNRVERLNDYPEEQAETMAFRKGEQRDFLAVGTLSGRIFLYAIDPQRTFSSPELLRVLEGHAGRITSLDFSAELPSSAGLGQVPYLASASMDETVRLWDISEQGKYELPTVLDDYENWIWDLQFSPDNATLLAVAHDGWLRTVPIRMDLLAESIGPGISDNFSETEWKTHVSRDRVPWEATCPQLPQPPMK